MSDPNIDDSPFELDDDPVVPNFPNPDEMSKIQDMEMDDDDLDDDMDYERELDNEDEAEDDVEDEDENKVVSAAKPTVEEKIDMIGDDEDDQDDDDDEDENEEDNDENLKKLERDIDNDKILKHHPEIIQNNYDEILALCKIIRNDKGIIVDELHKTYPFITKYEYARIIGMRAKQINNGADPFVKVDREMIDGYTIAQKEMEEKKVPFIIARPLPNGGREYWKVQDLELIHF
jgi:DNA-directed RNA polymerase I, II, and III subunit RPABC2